MTTWKKQIDDILKAHGETMDNVVSIVFEDNYWGRVTKKNDIDFVLRQRFPSSRDFAMWTKERVYFLATYDGGYWIDSVPRNPNGKAIDPIGG